MVFNDVGLDLCHDRVRGHVLADIALNGIAVFGIPGAKHKRTMLRVLEKRSKTAIKTLRTTK